MQDFKKLSVWEKSYKLSLEIYGITAKFPKEEVYSLTNQMRRAAISIPANIAEGCGRYTGSELARFLDIAMGSGSELECYILLSHDLGYVSDDDYGQAEGHLVEVKRMLNALILKIRGEAATNH
jgi:four helix bundle protein